ncbi:MAG TPA: IS21 family transposase [Pseudomonas sp.]|jgi:transposase|uniref:IS21 family transposase n=1 Tax=Salinicola salarius TaxID=430457 RepID=UPI000B40588E|nr:IS21 family transposase [Salinicola salarius]HAF90320.1 IS21 family transposase [Pseudomonas sp.]|tara:strand:- start:1108 stop:2130 length:1023 start_codon:yes stop_codon:yes gene_type:complete
MLTQEQSVEIKVLARQGHGIKAIARELGLSRNTVRKYLRGEKDLPRYKARAPRPGKLDAFKPYLQGRIAAARPHWIPATVLMREIQAQGYAGGISQLKAYLAPFKGRPEDPVVRFETPPGKQLQVDFTTIRRGREPLKAFVATLGYSRATFVRFSTREDSEAWLTGLREAFVYFGGVPEEALFDNAGTIITERDAYGDGRHRWHPALAALAEEYGFRPRVCRPYRAKTKGKVERFNGYLKGSFITPLAATLKSAGLILDVPTANAHIGRWLDEIAHQRVHGTTGVPPAMRLAEERGVLLPLPATATSIVPVPALRSGRALPHESLQHPLSVYDQLLEASP